MRNQILNSNQRELKKITYQHMCDNPETIYGQLLLNQNHKQIQSKKKFKEIQPLKLLDAPNVTQQCEYQLLDWSSQNIIYLGLKENLFIRNFKTGTTQLLTQIEDGIITSVNSMDDLVAYSTSNGDIILADSEQKQQLQSYQINDITRMTSFQDNLLFCATLNNGILYADLRQNKYIYKIGTLTDVYTITLNKQILAAGSNNKVSIYDIRNPSIVIAQYNQDGMALAWDQRKKDYLCAGGKDQKITIWNTQDDYKPQYQYVEGNVTQIICSNSKLIYSSGNKCYDGCYIMNRHQDSILRLALSPNDAQLCSLGQDELLIFWELLQ